MMSLRALKEMRKCGLLQDSVNSGVEDVNWNGKMGIIRRKTKIVCTIGPSTSSKEMIWKLAETGMNVARLNMSHGDHSSHQNTIDLVKQYNSHFPDKVVAVMLDTKVLFVSPRLIVCFVFLIFRSYPETERVFFFF